MTSEGPSTCGPAAARLESLEEVGRTQPKRRSRVGRREIVTPWKNAAEMEVNDRLCSFHPR